MREAVEGIGEFGVGVVQGDHPLQFSDGKQLAKPAIGRVQQVRKGCTDLLLEVWVCGAIGPKEGSIVRQRAGAPAFPIQQAQGWGGEVGPVTIRMDGAPVLDGGQAGRRETEMFVQATFNQIQPTGLPHGGDMAELGERVGQG